MRADKNIVLFLTILTSFTALAWARARSDQVVDPRDEARYSTVNLGEQVWLAENLRFDAGNGSRCQANLTENCETYGRLYQWRVAQKACLPGWRLPSEEDWQELERFLGLPEPELAAEMYRGTNEGQRLRVGGDTGFEVKLAGYMRSDGTVRRVGERAAFWTSTLIQDRDDVAWHRDISLDPRIHRSPVDTVYFLSVRCVKSLQTESSMN